VVELITVGDGKEEEEEQQQIEVEGTLMLITFTRTVFSTCALPGEFTNVQSLKDSHAAGNSVLNIFRFYRFAFKYVFVGNVR